jgi:serine/threonine protein phosphatase PrpC
MSNPPGPPPEEQGNDKQGQPRLPFDEALCQKFRELINDSFNRHPELRSVAVVFDYHGGLNSAQVNKGLWLGENGAVKDIASVFSSLRNLMAMAETQFGRAVAVEEALRTQVTLLTQELTNRAKENESNRKPDGPSAGS